MAVIGCLPIDRAKEIQLLNDLGRFEIEDVPDRALQFLLIHLACAERIDAHADWLRVPNGVRKRNFTSIRQTGGHDILRYPAAHVSRAAVDFGWIFSRERAAAVPSHSAVGVADDFAARDACVALRAADHEPARWID